MSPSFQTEELNESQKVNNQVSSTPVVLRNRLHHALISISDSLNLAPFSNRAVVDFGDCLVVGSPSTRYLRLRNPLPSSMLVRHCSVVLFYELVINSFSKLGPL